MDRHVAGRQDQARMDPAVGHASVPTSEPGDLDAGAVESGELPDARGRMDRECSALIAGPHGSKGTLVPRPWSALDPVDPAGDAAAPSAFHQVTEFVDREAV